MGDIVFMGGSGDMLGHAVLLVSEVTSSTLEREGETIEVISFYVFSTSSDTEEGCYGGRQFTFEKQKNGSWRKDGDGYVFRGYGQMTNVKVSEEEKARVVQSISDLQTNSQ